MSGPVPPPAGRHRRFCASASHRSGLAIALGQNRTSSRSAPAAWAAALVTIGLACALITMPFLAAAVAAVVSAALAGFIVYAAARMIGRH